MVLIVLLLPGSPEIRAGRARRQRAEKRGPRAQVDRGVLHTDHGRRLVILSRRRTLDRRRLGRWLNWVEHHLDVVGRKGVWPLLFHATLYVCVRVFVSVRL